jgi:hypothetical protein
MLQVTATEDLSAAAMRYKAITYAGTIAQDTKRVAGIMRFGANSGNIATAVIEGITKGDCSTAVTTVGWPLKVVTSGWLAAAASGDQVIGRALAACASGDRVVLTLDAKVPAQWGG